MKRSKAYRAAEALADAEQNYTPEEAIALAKKGASAKFDETIDVAMRLGVDPRKADQMVRGTVNLPHGTGKTARVLVFATGDRAAAAEEAGADEIGADELIEKVAGGYLDFDAATAGGLMTPEPVVLGPDATVADCLALLRNEEVTPALAAMAFICRPPLDTPTGRFLGAVHIQRLLREPPSVLAAGFMDASITPLSPGTDVAHVARYFATYDLVCAPVVNDAGQLVGAVTVDDVLDHILPADWRGLQLAEGVNHGAATR